MRAQRAWLCLDPFDKDPTTGKLKLTLVHQNTSIAVANLGGCPICRIMVRLDHAYKWAMILMIHWWILPHPTGRDRESGHLGAHKPHGGLRCACFSQASVHQGSHASSEQLRKRPVQGLCYGSIG